MGDSVRALPTLLEDKSRDRTFPILSFPFKFNTSFRARLPRIKIGEGPPLPLFDSDSRFKDLPRLDVGTGKGKKVIEGETDTLTEREGRRGGERVWGEDSSCLREENGQGKGYTRLGALSRPTESRLTRSCL